VEGIITYPRYATVEKVSFKPPGFVSLNSLEQCRPEELDLDPEHPGKRRRLRRIAGRISTRSHTFPIDRRLALLDALWHNEELTRVFRVMREVFSATRGR
jgi:hypothetical protein